jgi:hypothetical protein
MNIIVRHSGQFADVSGSGTTNYTSILQWYGNGNQNQQWHIVPVGSSNPTATPVATATPMPTQTPLTGTVDKRISQGSDDSEESKSSGYININCSDI